MSIRKIRSLTQDMTGKVHLSKQIEGLKGDNNVRLDIENLPNGSYFMRINDSIFTELP